MTSVGKGISEMVEEGEAGSTELLEALIHHGNSKKQGSAFLEKLYEILMNEEYNDFISWCGDGKSILIKKVEDFSQIVLPKYYKHNNFQSFVRQLNMYNFTKTSHDANRREFMQPFFRKGKRNFLPLISRKTQKSIRSFDSALENIETSDLYEVVSSNNEILQGKPLSRSKSVDRDKVIVRESSLWEVIHELKTRVDALEKKLYQLSNGEICPQSNVRNKTSFVHNNNNPARVFSCTTLNSENKRHHPSNCFNNCHDGNYSTKKMRSNSEKSDSTVSSLYFEDDSIISIMKPRSRSTSDSSIESLQSMNSSWKPRVKRGVDAILSAAEILHDSLPLREEAKKIVQKDSSIDHTQSTINPPLSNAIQMRPSVKKRKSYLNNSSSADQSVANDSKQVEGNDSQSDSSASPLYFQNSSGDNFHKMSRSSTSSLYPMSEKK